MNKKEFIWIFLSIVFSLFLVLFFIDFKKEDWFLVFWGVFGTNVTILGMIYTLYQITQLKSESKIIQDAVKETKDKIHFVNGYADVARGIQLIKEIQGHMRSNKFEVGVIRLQELKMVVSAVKKLNFLQTEPVEMESINKDINFLINDVEKEISSGGKTLKVTRLNSSLERIFDSLDELQNKLK
jgi:hypothetical protein